jgi:hypothetical protein
VSRPRAADDFVIIRARMDELRREREAAAADPQDRSGKSLAGRESDVERRRRRERVDGMPPPWVPTIFVRRQRG